MTSRNALVAVALLAAPLSIAAQQQASVRAGWPCAARLDPSYFRVAEGTGGQLLLLTPEEISDSARLLTAISSHQQTIFRLAGTVPPGVHEFQIPIDPSVESVVFSVSVQCLQLAEVLQPSGEHANGDGVTDLSNFRAVRMVIVTRPAPGLWTVRVAGSGVAGVTVQARTALALAHVEFAQQGFQLFRVIPWASAQNTVKLCVSQHPAKVHASIMSGGFERLMELALEAGQQDGEYVSRFTPNARGFRVLVTGEDADGFVFQRMHAPLLTPMP